MTVNPHTTLCHLSCSGLLSALTEADGLQDITSSLTFLSSLPGGCTPRGVADTAPKSVLVSPLHFTTTSLPSWGSRDRLERPLEVAIGSQDPRKRAKRKEAACTCAVCANGPAFTHVKSCHAHKLPHPPNLPCPLVLENLLHIRAQGNNYADINL